MTGELRKTGISAVGDMPWGTHFCHFYQTRHDLLDTVIPYLKTGLENDERCLWVTMEPPDQQTRDILRRAIPGIDRHVTTGDIRILPYTEWYLDKNGIFDPRRVVAGWDLALAQALDKGYAGLRASADEAWLGKKYWQAFADYEQELDEPISRQRMLVMCAYPLASCEGGAIFDVARTHQFATAERHGIWQTLETPELKHAKTELARLNADLEQRVVARTGELEAANEALREEMLQRQQAEATHARLAAVVESSDDAILSKTLDGTIVTWNAGAERLYGYSAEETVGRPVTLLFPPDRPDELARIKARLEQGQRIEHFETVRVRKDGTRVDVSITFSPIRDAAGRVTGTSAIARDITERKRSEAERRAREAAESASRAKSEFLAHMSHELRSPLTTILGFAQLLARAGLPEQAARDLRLILGSAEHLLTLINHVLDLSKIEAGRATLEERQFDLHQLLADLREMFAHRAEARGLALVFERRDLPRCVQTDQMKLRQVLINLLSNAIKFTAGGRITVTAQATASPGRLAFAVADTGPGIAPDELQQLFAAFVQAEAGRRAGEGSGLGLTISRSFVRLMGGELAIDSRPGEGTTVRFEIAAQTVPEQECPRCEATAPVVALAPEQPRRRLLVVDDRAETRELLVRLLGPLGFELKEAADGLEAVELCRGWQPDLVWMDMRLPHLDGREATRRIKAGTARPPVVIALTASGYEEERDEMLAAGCDDFQRKPFREEEIFTLLERHLGVRFVRADEAGSYSAPRLEESDLSELPAFLRSGLAQALIRLDTDAVERALETVRSHDARLGHALAALASEFQYEQMLQLLQRSRGDAPP